jgi:putative ABC transport system ATP-binding protein
MASATPLIRLDHVSKHYDEGGRQRIVLRDVSAEVAPGEFIVLIGKSGSGKSTLLNLVSGIDTPSSGEVSVAGEVLTRMPERERTLFRRRRIGFIFQFFNLVPTLTVLENLLLPLELNGRTAPNDRRHALDLLEQVGLADRRDVSPDRLSGGEQQRIAVARALVHDPALVLADEPTGNLDADTGSQIIELMFAMNAEAGTTLILVTHDEALARRCGRTLRLSGGRLDG